MTAANSAAPAPGVVTLATSACHRLLAWPRYERAIDLDTLVRTFGPAFSDRDDVCLCLRHDPAIDIPLPDAIAAVSAELTRAAGPDPRFEVLMVDNPLDEGGWSSLARAITGVILLPWSWDVQRQRPLAGLGHPLMTSAEDLRRHLAQKGRGPNT
jgi:hypothetical protein